MTLRAESVDAYIKSFPKATAVRLKAIRFLVKKAAPKVEEKISYGIPAYTLGGTPLLYFGGFARHSSLFVLPKATGAFKKELATFKTSKGTIQFPHDKPLPLALIRKVIAYRVKEIRSA